jgi:glycosyltransferase involved in cell wall biosynthesis
MSVSIIIPAFNEEIAISSTLTALKPLFNQPDAQIIVVCNGCTDKTAQVVKKMSSAILCLETSIGSKAYALNLGDEAAQFFPRVYLDADIVLSVEAVNAMIEKLEDERIFATSVAPKMVLHHSSWAVRAFYEVWLDLPYCKAGMIGSGVYALSAAGRARFERFPSLIADDGFIRCLFTEEERPLTSSVYAIVKAPRDLISLIKIQTRSRLGGYELREKFPHLIKNERKDYGDAVKSLFLNYKLWLKAATYIAINLISRWRAGRQYAAKQTTQWERDESSRKTP